MAAHHIEAGREHERIANRIGDASPIDSDAHHEAKYLHYQAAELHTKAANTNDPQHKEEARNATKEALHMSKSENQSERNPTIDHHNSKLSEQANPPFTPDKKKQMAVAGKYGREYSTARHLARMGVQAALKDLKKGPEKGSKQV